MKRYKTDVFKIWEIIDETIFNSLYSFSPLELAKIKFGMSGTKPKVGSLKTHKAILDLIKDEIKMYKIEEILYIYHAFRMETKNYIHSVIFEEILKRKEEADCIIRNKIKNFEFNFNSYFILNLNKFILQHVITLIYTQILFILFQIVNSKKNIEKLLESRMKKKLK